MLEKNQKPKRGRPRKSEAEKRPEYLDVRLDVFEKKSFKDAANLAGVPLSTWVRERLRNAARRELIEAGHSVAFLQRAAERGRNG